MPSAYQRKMAEADASDKKDPKTKLKPGKVKSVHITRGQHSGASVRIEHEPKKSADGKEAPSYEPSHEDFFSNENEAFNHARKHWDSEE